MFSAARKLLQVAGISCLVTSWATSEPAIAAPPVIPLPGQFVMSALKSTGIVWAKGVWTLPNAPADNRIADPINSVKIECVKERRICTEATATVVDGTDPRKDHYLDVDIAEFEVTSWTAQEIVAETQALCVSTTLTINLVRKEIFKVSRNGGVSADQCKSLPGWKSLESPTVGKLVGSFEAARLDPRLR